MIRIGLRRDTPLSEIDKIKEWLVKNDEGGYVGEGDIYWTDDMRLKFYPVLFLTNEEAAFIFKLTFVV